MRCVVFSNFGGDYFDKSIRPKLESIGLDVVKVVHPHKESDFSLDYDLLVGFQDMTIKSQRDAMRAASRRHGKPTIFLSRSNPSWDKEISDKMAGFVPPVQSESTPEQPERIARESCASERIARIAGVPKDKIGALLGDYVRAIESGETDFSSLFEEALGRPLSDPDEVVSVLSSIRSYDECPAFFREWASAREPRSEIVPEPTGDEDQILLLYAEENAFLRAEIESMREEIESLRAAVEVDGGNRVPEDGDVRSTVELNNLKQEISAIRDLRESGAMSDAEVLRMFLLIPVDT